MKLQVSPIDEVRPLTSTQAPACRRTGSRAQSHGRGRAAKAGERPVGIRVLVQPGSGCSRSFVSSEPETSDRETELSASSSQLSRACRRNRRVITTPYHHGRRRRTSNRLGEAGVCWIVYGVLISTKRTCGRWISNLDCSWSGSGAQGGPNDELGRLRNPGRIEGLWRKPRRTS